MWGNWYLQYRPLGRKIQDAWAANVYKVLDVQGTTYAVEPLEGGPVKRVHTVGLICGHVLGQYQCQGNIKKCPRLCKGEGI